MKHFALWMLVALWVALPLTAFAQSDAPLPPFAAVQDGQLVLGGAQGDVRPVLQDTDIQYLAWNADGSTLAFVARDANYNASLGWIDAATGQVHQLQTPPLEAGFNVSWTRDGRILYAAPNPSTEPAQGPEVPVDVWAVEPVEGAQPQLLGTIQFGVGCGGGSPLPADWVYWSETGGFGGFFITLQDTPAGTLYSLNCGGNSLGLLNPATGETTPVGQNLAKAVVSPDGTRVAGVEINMADRSASRLVVIDLATLTTTEVPTAGEPDQLAWSADGQALYYSVRTPDSNLLADFTAEQQAQLDEILGFAVADLPAYASSIHRVDLATGQDEQVYADAVYAIGRMIDTADGLYFSVIPNVQAWLNALVGGEVDMQTFDASQTLIRPLVLRVAHGSTEALPVGLFDQFTPVTTQVATG